MTCLRLSPALATARRRRAGHLRDRPQMPRTHSGRTSVNAKVWLTGAALLIIAAPVAAQQPTTLTDETYFQWRPRFDNKKAVGTCGYGIFGNHRSRADPKVEWDVNVDEIFHGDQKIVGVSAGSFDVVGGKRKARAAITRLEFTFEGRDGCVAARVVGAPNKDNGIRAVVEPESTELLFDALSTDKYFVVSFKYADGSSDAIRMRGYRDPDHRTKMSVFARCVRGDPPAILGPLFPVP